MIERNTLIGSTMAHRNADQHLADAGRGSPPPRRYRALVALALLLTPSAAGAQLAPNGDLSVTVTGTPTLVIPPAGRTTRSQIILQVQGTAAVACRSHGVPGFTGGSIVLLGGTSTPAIGGSVTLTGAAADARAWSCVAYPVGGAATSILTVKVYP